MGDNSCACASLVQVMWAQCRHASGVLIDGLQSLYSQRGGHQGDPLMNPGMALALLPHAKWLQAQLKASEGFVLAQSDDHWAFGDPAILFDTPAGQGLHSRFTDRVSQISVCR